MAFCSNCGAELAEGARFCHVCGAEVGAAGMAAAQTVAYAGTYPAASTVVTSGYSLVVLSVGSCPVTQADDVLQDLLGYTQAESTAIVAALPTQVAQGLSEQQALYLAQAFTEYGMQVAVYLGNTLVDLGTKATTSVFGSDGNLLTGALTALGALTVANRMGSFLRWALPVPRPFAPRYTPRPPRHVRRSIFDWFKPKPKPASQPVPRPNNRAVRNDPDFRTNRGSMGGGARGGNGPQPGGRGAARGGRGPQGGLGGRR